MPATIPAFLIPIDGRATGAIDLPTDADGFAVHGSEGLPEIGCSPVDVQYHDGRHGTVYLSFWFDETGSHNGNSSINHEAMRAIDAFTLLEDCEGYEAQGNCVVTSFNPETGLSQGLAAHVVDALTQVIETVRQ